MLHRGPRPITTSRDRMGHRKAIPSENADQAKAGVVLRKERATGTGGRCTAALTPSFALEERLDALTNLITNLADPSDRFPFGILQRPVVALQTRDDRTLIDTSHRDQHLHSLRQLR